MATLTNTQISVTYVGLLKTSANTVLSSSAQQITDGDGNNSIMFLSTAGVGIGGAAASGKELDVTGNVLITGDLQVDNLNIDGNTISATSGVVTLANGAIATTQSQNDNSTKIATTAYVDTAIDGVDTLAEILAIGNTTGATKISVNNTSSGIDFIDNAKARFGTGNDLEIYHDGTDSFIKNNTGLLRIEQNVTDGDIQIKADDGGGSETTYIFCDGSTGKVELSNLGVKKFETTPQGIQITGEVELGEGTANKIQFIGGQGNWRVNISDSANQFIIHSESLVADYFTVIGGGGIKLNAYGSGSKTGTVAKNLAVDSSGNIIETDGSIVDGSGTANDVVMWSDSNTLTDAPIAISGNNAIFAGNINTGKDKYLRFTGESSGSDAAILFGNSSGTGGSLTFKRNSDATAILTLNADTSSSFGGELNVQAATHSIANIKSGNNDNILFLQAIQSDNARVGTSTNTPLSFFTNSAERARIDSSGNLLIGTTTSGGKLNIESAGTAINLTRSGQETYKIIHGTSGLFINLQGVNLTGHTQDHDFKVFNTSGSAFVTADGSTDRLGVGTESPELQTHIFANDTSNKQLMIDQDSTGDAVMSFRLTGVSEYVMGIDNSDGDKFKIANSGTVGTATRLTLDSSGQVGIGTASPGATLEVFGTGNSLRLDSAANQSKTILFRNVGSGTAEIKTDGDLKLNAEDSGKTIQLFTEDTERMRIDSSGNSTFAGRVQGTNFNSIENSTDGGFTDTRDYLLAGTGDRGGALVINDVSGARHAIIAGGFDLTFAKETDNGAGTKQRDVYMRANASSSAGIVTSVDIFRDTNIGGSVTITQNSGSLEFSNTGSGHGSITTGSSKDLNIGSGSGTVFINNNTTFAGNITSTGTSITLDSAGSADYIADRLNDTSGATYQYKTNGTLKWYHGLRGLSNNDFYLFNNTASENALVITESGSNATFSGAITAPGLTLNRSTNSGAGMGINMTNTNTSGNSFATINIAGANGTVNTQIFSDGNNTGGFGSAGAVIRTSTNHPMFIGTNSTTAITISTGQLVTFAGNVNLADSKKIRFGAGEDLQIQHNGTDSQITNSTGHLQFTNTANDKDITFATDDGSGGDTEYFRIDGGAEQNIFSKDVAISNANGNLNFTSGNGNIQTTTGSTSLVLGVNSSEKMRIHSSGNIGIATDSPDFTLDVAGSIGIDDIIYHNGDHNTRFEFGGDEIHLRTGGTDRLSVSNTKVHLNEVTQIGSSGTSNLYLGNVISASSADRGMRLHTNNADFFFDFQGDAVNQLFFRDYDGSGGIHTRHEFRIDNGSITISGSLTQNGSPSDIKYKENIKTISNGIDKIQKLNPVEFDWNDKSDAHKIGKKEDAGFIAQEVQKVLPNLVNENVDGDLALNYEGIIPYLVQSIQELKKEIEILKNK